MPIAHAHRIGHDQTLLRAIGPRARDDRKEAIAE
jgi:hypothetical protein